MTIKEKLKELDYLSYELDETRERICDEYMNAIRQIVSEAIHTFVEGNTFDDDDCIEVEVPEEKLILMTEEIIKKLSNTHL